MLKRVGKSCVHNVRQKLRQLARLLILLRSQDKQLQDTEPTTCFSVFIPSGNFDYMIACVRQLCMSEAEKETKRGCPKYDETTLALKIGHFSGKMANIKIGTAIHSGDCFQRQQAEDYLILQKKEWDEKISSHARQTVAERKYNKPNILPLTQDVVNLRKFLLQEINWFIELLNSHLDLKAWRKLALATLCRVTVFNKRRGDETGQITTDLPE